jgi:hypothetical protein
MTARVTAATSASIIEKSLGACFAKTAIRTSAAAA